MTSENHLVGTWNSYHLYRKHSWFFKIYGKRHEGSPVPDPYLMLMFLIMRWLNSTSHDQKHDINQANLYIE